MSAAPHGQLACEESISIQKVKLEQVKKIVEAEGGGPPGQRFIYMY